MISDFSTAAQGHPAYIDDSGVRTSACKIIKYGSSKNHDGWWASEMMILQIWHSKFMRDIYLPTYLPNN